MLFSFRVLFLLFAENENSTVYKSFFSMFFRIRHFTLRFVEVTINVLLRIVLVFNFISSNFYRLSG